VTTGTSLSSPCWAGLIAIANQGRVADGGASLNSVANPEQALQALYSLPAGDFRKIASGYNGIVARAGYNEVTGLGSPVANLLVPGLASYGLTTRPALADQPAGKVALS
jgi:subtilase family serine protease